MYRLLAGLLSASLVSGCAQLPLRTSAEPELPVPQVDHHLHLVSPTVAEVSRGKPLPTTVVPPAVSRLLQIRATSWNNADALAAVYTPEATIVVDQWNRHSGIFEGAKPAADFLSTRFGRAYDLTPVKFRSTGSLAHIVGYYTRGEPPAQARIGYFSMSLVKDQSGEWKIAAETPSFPQQAAVAPVSAEALVAMLDEAGMQRGVVHSAAVVFGGKWVDFYRSQQTPEERRPLVQAENDWNAAEAGRYPDRLVSFCSFNVLDPFAVEELRRCAASGHAGLKLHFDVDGTDFLNPAHRKQARSVFSAANELGMPIMVHVQNNEGSYEDTLSRYRLFLDDVVSSAPDISVQIAHLWGGGGFSESGLKAFAELVESGHPATGNLYFDLGDVPNVILQQEPAKAKEMARIVVEQSRRIGLERIVFGSDGGMEGFQTPAQAWKALLEHFPFSRAELSLIANNTLPYVRNSR